MKMPAFAPSLACLWLPAAVVAGLLAWSLPSLLITKKVFALLLMPAGWVWLGLMAAVAWPGLNRRGRGLAFLLLVVFTLAGNSWFGGFLLGRLEQPFVVLPAVTEPFEAVFVLGGGTSARPDGGAQLGPAGDRLMVPALMYHAGKTRHLVASGLSVTEIGKSRDLAGESAMLWRELGIPDSAIIRLDTPRTTREEILEYKKLIQFRSWRRVGVCSSAWHLRRVETICRREGMNMIPIPADFLSSPLPWNAMYAVPQARGFQNVQKALWEYLGALTGG
jgi:uncharacterized SAM-binding protein YcdF (DUF218 family)